MSRVLCLSMRSLSLSAVALVLAACPTAVAPVEAPACTTDQECALNERCLDGACEPPLSDLTGEGEGEADGTCASTAECPMTHFCNGATGACAPLADGWCRQPSDCSTANPVCSAASSAVAGLCVECTEDADCDGGARCGGGGVCQGNTDDDDDECPANAVPSPAGCRCNSGFTLDDETRACIPNNAAGCVDNASPVPGQPGRCECDTGYQPSPGGNACVRPDANNEDPEDAEEDDSIIGDCGPNTIAIYFICFCLPGYDEDPTGAEGCVPETDDDDDVGEGEGEGTTDVCETNGWYNDDVCDTFCATPDPDCTVDGGDPEQETDVCADNNWYGDGACDEFCVNPDPDCATTDTCAANGWYDDGVCDTFCTNPDPDCAETDTCLANGWYNDGDCDEFCAQPDPDCDTGSSDVCADNGWYGDMQCDAFCPSPDPDCDDACANNGWYGDMQCDAFCPSPDPDCSDACVTNNWYGDGECDAFCPLTDPDC